MKNDLHRAGLIVAISIPLFVLPARISEGQWNDPVNLIGSEVVIFLMSLTCWYVINHIQKKHNRWAGLILSLLCCCFLSNVFYFTFNPIFKDFPFRTAQNPIGIKILMLCSRGVLMSIILIPAAYYLKRDRESRHQRRENERLALEKIKIENRLLEQAVQDRTRELQQALISLEGSQRVLEHQLFVQSRLVASITHDISGPLKFLVLVSEKIHELASAKDYDLINGYSQELYKSLERLFGFVQTLLEFTKLPIQQKIGKLERLNLAKLIIEKSELFEGSVRKNANALQIEVDPSITLTSNFNLLAIVIHNLIDNANKHTRKGLIKINSIVDPEGTHLLIENSGGPIGNSVKMWLNLGEEYLNEKDSLDDNELQGIGLILTKEITRMLGIKIFVESDINSTRVTLSFEPTEGPDMLQTGKDDQTD